MTEPVNPHVTELARLDEVMAELSAREVRLREEYAAVAAELRQTWVRRSELLALAAAGTSAAGPAPAARPSAAGPAPPETSTRTVQTLLFVLGGLLLGTGAIVFTAVAWTRFGVTGRAAILGGVTALVLAAPVVARARGLRGTAETFAAIGLLLLLLDGYAVWSVDLFGARGVTPASWAAAVCATAAAAAAGYARGTRLAGPAFAALVLTQPVWPLLAYSAEASGTAWAYGWVVLAIGQLALIRYWRGPSAVRVALRACGWVFTGGTLIMAGGWGVAAMFAVDTAVAALIAGGALIGAAAALAGVARISGVAAWRPLATVAVMFAVALVAGRATTLAVAWWAAAAVDLLVAAGLALAAAQARRVWIGVVRALVALSLIGHALLVAVATAAATAAVLAAVATIGVVTAASAYRWASGHGATSPDAAGSPGDLAPADARPVLGIGRAALVTGLVAVPGAVAAATFNAVDLADGAVHWPPRAALAATTLLLVAVAVARRWVPGYVSAAAAAVHVATPVAIIGGLTEGPAAVGSYAGAALLVLTATALLRAPASRGWWLAARTPAALVVVVAAVPQVVTVLIGPYQWLGRIWDGAPTSATPGVTLPWPDRPATPFALALLAGAAVLAGRLLVGRWRVGLLASVPVAAVATLVLLVQLNAPWPALPAVSLLTGVALVLAAALRGAGARAVAVAGFGAVLAGAGLAGALPARWSTLMALGVVVAAAGVAGWVGRSPAARVAGWTVASLTAMLLAAAGVLAADLPVRAVPAAVLPVAALALAASGLLRTRRAEAVAAEVAAHLGAVVALLLAGPPSGDAAAVATVWGLVLGLRALWRGEATAGRLARAGAAGGWLLLAWWLLLAAWDVASVETYTVPPAVAAAVTGWLVLRSQPEIGSWVALGPALVAGFLPSGVAALADPVPLRRLLLGAVAVLVVMLGAHWRWRAPVLVGGAVAVLVAVRELTLAWHLLDTWIPLTVAGLLLVALAATYERRRRDLAQLRAAVGRMT